MKKPLFFIALMFCGFVIKAQENGTFTDPRDGKVYKTVTIGTQTWFAENLAFKLDNGCYAYRRNEYNVSKYGYLYLYETAKNACPSGWHLPNDIDWNNLINFLGGKEVAGVKLKQNNVWTIDTTTITIGYTVNNNTTNESGFSALPAGVLTIFSETTALFRDEGLKTQFWSVDKGGFGLYSKLGDITTVSETFMGGSSVRCIKD